MMKKFILCNSGQTIIEYALVLSFFIGVFTIALPPLRDATVVAINRVAEQMVGNIVDNDNESGSSPGDDQNNEPWFPPELDFTDNNVIYSANNINLTGSSRIYGNVIANGSVTTGPSSGCYIDGNVTENANYDFNFPMPVFPDFPTDDIAHKGSYTAGWWPPPQPITEDGYYSSLKVVNTLPIHTGEEGDVRTIVLDDFELSGSGKINLEGDGKLILVIKDNFKLTSNTLLNFGGLPENLVIYYEGSDDMDFGQGHVSGSVFTKSSGVMFSGSTTIKGNIFVGGDSVTVASGNVNLSDALLYAPNSNLSVTGSSSVKGRMIANDISLTGNSTLIFEPILLDDTFFWD